MLGWIIFFAVLALVFAVVGFGGLAGGFATIAQILFYVFIALLVVSFISRAVRGESIA